MDKKSAIILLIIILTSLIWNLTLLSGMFLEISNSIEEDSNGIKYTSLKYYIPFFEKELILFEKQIFPKKQEVAAVFR